MRITEGCKRKKSITRINYKKALDNYQKPFYICTPNRENDSVAQLVEQYTFNVRVLGSSPSGITAASITFEVRF